MESLSELVPEQEYEAAALYMDLCHDATRGARILGILLPERAAEAIADPATITVDAGGVELPAIVPMRYANGAGYDVRRCCDMLQEPQDSSDVWYYAFPAGVAMEPELQAMAEGLATKESGYVFFDHLEDDDSALQELAAVFERAELYAQEVPLLDEKVHTQNKQASIVLYGADVPGEGTGIPDLSMQDIYQAYRTRIVSGEFDPRPHDGTVLLSGQDIDDALMEELWKLYQDRFEWLGESHPISMEDDRSYFADMMRSESTITSAHFKDGELKCFGYFLGDASQVFWLNPDFLTDPAYMHTKPGQSFMFWPGIVARAEGGGYAANTIGLVSEAVAAAGGSIKIVFENTNRSEQYIPRIIKGSVDAAQPGLISMPEPISRHMYRCLHFERQAPPEDMLAVPEASTTTGA